MEPEDLTYENYIRQIQQNEINARPLSSMSRLAQVGSAVIDDPITGHVVGYKKVTNGTQILSQLPRPAVGWSRNEYDDVLDKVIPTANVIDYSNYGF